MGIPSFFRWLSTRYPRITTEVVEEVQYDPLTRREVRVDASGPNPNGVEFDNLYLDMNGIIHPCTHPEDRPPPRTEEAMFEAVCDYIDRIVGIVRPRKLLYVAIDGVAPRAKINQQRSRRFLAVQEAAIKEREMEKLREEWELAGLTLPTEEEEDEEDEEGRQKFDSNVITPGTPFMSRIAVALKDYIADRMESDAAWKNLRVIFSDASVPGEGEHKIAEFIRVQRAQKDYNPGLRHVLYGLDADLIMLGLATHEVHFTILREEVFRKNGRSFGSEGKRDRGSQSKNTLEKPVANKIGGVKLRSEVGGKVPFEFLHISVLREYLENEFQLDIEMEHKASQSYGNSLEGFKYDLERVIDDFVFLCFFVGNDFLPHLPTFNIREGAIEYLIELYKTYLPSTGYLVHDAGEVDFDRVRKILRHAATKETEVFQERMRRQRAEKDREKARQENEKAREAGRKRSLVPEKRSFIPPDDELIVLGNPRKKPHVGTEAANAAAAATLRKSLTGTSSLVSGSGGKASDISSEKKSTEQRTVGNVSETLVTSKDGRKQVETSEMQVSSSASDVRKFEPVDTSSMKPAERGTTKVPGRIRSAQVAEKEKPQMPDTLISKSATGGDARLEDRIPRKALSPQTTGDLKQAPSPREEKKEAVKRDEKAVRKVRYEEELRSRVTKEIAGKQDEVRLGDPGWKARYYESKFKWPLNDFEKKEKMIKHYMEGLVWVLKYYYRGCTSWNWYYPYHYAPFASDIAESKVASSDIKFEQGTPFLPFAQLMGVMPASSGAIVLPKCYSSLMSDPNSPIIDYYPTNFKIDLNGKRYPSQGVVLLPFVEEKRLLDAISGLYSKLAPEEKQRNSFGDPLIIAHKESGLGAWISAAKEKGKTTIETPVAERSLFGAVEYRGALKSSAEAAVFHLPEKRPHSSALLADAPQVEAQLDSYHKAEAGYQFGWRDARFGPLGRASRLLRDDRRRRLGPPGGARAYQRAPHGGADYAMPDQASRYSGTQQMYGRNSWYQGYPYATYYPQQYQSQGQNYTYPSAQYAYPRAGANYGTQQRQNAAQPRGGQGNYDPYTSAYGGAQGFDYGQAGMYYPAGAYQNQNQHLQYGQARYNNSAGTQFNQGDRLRGPSYNYAMNSRSYSSSGSYASGGRGLNGPTAATMRNSASYRARRNETGWTG